MKFTIIFTAAFLALALTAHVTPADWSGVSLSGVTSGSGSGTGGPGGEDRPKPQFTATTAVDGGPTTRPAGTKVVFVLPHGTILQKGAGRMAGTFAWVPPQGGRVVLGLAQDSVDKTSEKLAESTGVATSTEKVEGWEVVFTDLPSGGIKFVAYKGDGMVVGHVASAKAMRAILKGVTVE